MILIDYREETDAKKKSNLDLIAPIRQIGVKVESADLSYGDACFEGKGPNGHLNVGIERKRLHDMVTCIDDSRYSAHQRVGMKQMYDLSILMVEGIWRPHTDSHLLMEGFQGGAAWNFFGGRGRQVMYAKLRRYLLSVQLSGVIVMYTRDPWQTAFDITECFHYFQKPWDKHTSLLELHRLNIPSLQRRPTLLRRWAADLDGVGVKLSGMAERIFKSPLKLAEADEQEWLKVPGVGVKTAQAIVKDVRGWK